MNLNVGGLQPDHRIAIIGRAGRFPAARNVSEFWSMLAEGRPAAQRLSEAELLAAGVSRKTLTDPGYVRVANILPDMECFDASFFGFSPREAAILDPQHRHFLECGWEALEDAGHMPERFEGRIGVFAGSGMQAYLPFNLLSNPDLVEEVGLFLLRHTGNDKDFLPTRLSYLLNLTGPSVAVQTACSTSLVAVHIAIGSLLNMECDMAIAGGVTIELPHRTGYRYVDGEILSPDGLCRAFDDESRGTVFGSGAALVVLRRYEDAVAAGDDIKAVILSSAVNNDGASKASYLAPSVDGQAEAAAEALALSGIDAHDISYVETHGTGTPIGDPIELAALKEVYGAAPAGSIGIGSVKTNIGHLDTAAGSASLIKVVEALRHQYLPASLNFRKPNSRFDFANSPFRVVAEGSSWSSLEKPRRAAVNSLGVGGTNAHVILEEAPRRTPSSEISNWRIFPFSARTKGALERIRDRWSAFLDDAPPTAQDIAFTLREGRREFPERFAVAARNGEELKSALAAKASPFRQHGSATAERPRIVFLFPGGGAQYPGAGAGMLAASPVFAEAVRECFSLLPASAPGDLYDVMFNRDMSDTDARTKLGHSGYAIAALFILEYAYAKLWENWGVRPDAILAHSVGEYAGAVLAGGLRLADALKIVTLRGKVMDAAPAGAMTAVPLCADRVRELIGESLDIAAINTANSTVVSGPVSEIEVLEDQLAGGEHEARRVHIDVAAHSRQLNGQLDCFRAGFEGVAFGQLAIPMVSSLRGDWAVGDDVVSADYWVRHLRHTVRFADAAATVLEVANSIVIEVGPGQTLGPLVASATVSHPARAVLASAPRPRDGDDEMGVALAALAGLWANGVALDWDRLPEAKGRRVSLPTYPFEKERHWIAPGHARADASADKEEIPQLTRIEDPAQWIEVLDWVERPRSGTAPDLRGDWLVLAGNDAVSQAVLTTLSAAGARTVVLTPGDSFAANERGFTLRPDSQEDFDALASALIELPPRILSLWAIDPTQAERAFAASYLLARYVQQADPAPSLRMVFAVAGTVTLKGAAGEFPELAALLGAVRVGPREIAGLNAALIDINPTPDPSSIANALLAEAVTSDEADHIALRSTQRFVRARTRAPAPTENLPDRLRKCGVYVITGGTGGIGRELALWMADSNSARLALISRSASEDPGLRSRIESMGGEVMFLAADVTDRAELSSALDSIRARYGTIHGLVHAAGVLDDAPLATQTLDAALAVMAPKLTGAKLLHHLLPDGTLDFFAVLSSSSVVIGGAGQTAYVGANAALEALAAARSDGMSIAWGVWRDTGMAARTYGAGDAIGGGDPLLGHRSEKPDGIVCFETQIDPQTDWRVAEHVVAGKPVLPGTAYVEIVCAAAQAVMGSRHFELTALSFMRPMVFEGLPRRIAVEMRPTKDGYDIVVESSAATERDKIEHVRVKVVRCGEVDTHLPTSANAPGQLQVSPDSGRAPQKHLIAFGERWNSVGELRISDKEASGRFALPSSFENDLGTHALHPALLDMAATVGLATLPRGEHVYVPMSIGRIRVFAPLPASVSSHAVRISGEAGRFVSFNVSIVDDDGRPLIALEDFALREVEGQMLVGSQSSTALTTQLLATGICKSEAPEIFARVFAHPGRQLVVSPVSLDLIRLALAEKIASPQSRSPSQVAGAQIADPIAARLAGIWSNILGVAGIEPTDDFFALGGHSLNAVRMLARVRKEFGLTLPLATLFEGPRLGDLARLLHERGATAGVDPVAEAVRAVPVAVRQIGLTEGQREIAAGIAIDPSVSRAYNLSFSLHFEGAVDSKAVRTALVNLVARHDILRASFDLQAATLTIHPQRDSAYEEVDLTSLSDAEQAKRRKTLHDAVSQQPFDLANGPLLRAVLVRTTATRAELILFVHHIACDGWSMGVLLQDLAVLYAAALAGRTPSLPPASSVSELVTAEMEWAKSASAEQHRAFWMDKYAGALPAMELPVDRPYPTRLSTAADRVVTNIGPELESALRTRAQEAETSLRNLIFAAFRFYLSRVTGASDLVIGLPAAAQLAYGLESVVGHGVSLLPIRSQIASDATLGALLKQARQDLLGALDHQNYTHGSLIRDLHLPRNPSRQMLTPVVVNIDGLADLCQLEFGGLQAKLEVNSTGHEFFELFFNQFDAPGRVELTWNYKTALFNQNTISQHAQNFRDFLQAIASSPAALTTPAIDMLRGDNRYPASGNHVDPGSAGPQTITEVFRSVADRQPERIALRCGERTMDYRTLNARSDSLAALLISEGVRPGDLVGVSSHRSLSLLVAVLGVLKAGAGYVPFDVNLPADRLEFMARDTGIRILLGECPPVAAMGVRILSPTDFPTQTIAQPDPVVKGSSIAYVMFTSGTTGTPKGVVLPHRSVIRMLRDNDWLRLSPETVTLHSSAFAFDTSIIDIFGALLHGGTVVIPPDGKLSIADLSDSIESYGVNTLWLTSGLFHAVADVRPAAFSRVDQVVVGGDVVSPTHVSRVMAACPGLTVINGYGPTESNVTNAHAVTWADLRTGLPLPIGRAIKGTQIYILDENLQPVPTGLIGELCIAGRGLALGYWNRPELTSEKFVSAPWDSNLRLYRSGDMAMNPGDGTLRFYGRADTQVKIRGFRVELTEVEGALETHAAIRQAVVVATVPEGQTDKILVAYFLADGAPPAALDLAGYLSDRLPDFACPTFFVPLNEIPLNQNGKVDRRRLAAVRLGVVADKADNRAPAGATEIRLAAIWSELLGVKDISATANFFELGGHSLLAVRLFDKIRREFGHDLPISTLFRNQTVRELATLLEQNPASAEPEIRGPDAPWDTSTIIDPGPELGGRPLFVVGGVGGNVNNLFELGSILGRARPVVGFQTRGVQGHAPHSTIEEMAAENIRYMRQHQPEGPYFLAGYSGGAYTALEMARQLEAAGERVERLFALDTYAPGFARDFRPNIQLTFKQRLFSEIDLLRGEGLGYFYERLSAKLRNIIPRGPMLALMKWTSLSHYRYKMMQQAWMSAAQHYTGGPILAPVTLFRARPIRLIQKLILEQDPTLGWAAVANAALLDTPWVQGDHLSMLKGENARSLAAMIEERIGK